MASLSQVISSLHNPKIKEVAGLARRRSRDRSGLMVVEGHDEIAVAVAAGARMHSLFICPSLYPRTSHTALARRIVQQGVVVYEVTPVVFAHIAYRENPDGILAVVHAPNRSLADLALPSDTPPLLLVIEGVEKPGNLGAMLRTADAVGAHAVILADSVVDIANPNTARASKGTVFALPIVDAPTDAVLEWLERHAIALIGAAPDGPTPYTAVTYSGPVAIAVGAEATGLSSALRRRATSLVRIPMAGVVNSLNVSAAAAILLYEAARQRSVR